MSKEKPLIKLVAVGDGAVGKTCLLISYTEKHFPEQYVPTVFNNTTKDVTLKPDGKEVKEELKVCVDMWDTAGQEDFDRIRFLSYRGTDVFLICFSVVEPSSFENVAQKWLPEIKYHTKNTNPTIILVGLKSDLREDDTTLAKLSAQGKTPVTESQINKMLENSTIKAYKECSALQVIGIDDVFKCAITKLLASDGSEEGPTQSGGTKGCCTIL